MKRAKPALLTGLVFVLIAVGLIGASKLDHRTDRNVPGATTGVGRASLTDHDRPPTRRPD
jgi:hypothetical protein